MTDVNISLLHTLLFAWFQKHGRVLPWREKSRPGNKNQLTVRDQHLASYFTKKWNRDPYKVVISELMLQQTQVDRVLPKFELFLERWPTVKNLAQASRKDVMIAWQGLGYNRRARFLHEMAQTIVKQFDGKFPMQEKDLLKLPGIGKYTARAVRAFAYGEDVGVIDTNIQRIYSRVFFGTEYAQLKQNKYLCKALEASVDQSVPKGQGDPWNQALMDFGALICTAKSPKCEQCPVQTLCRANKNAMKQNKTYAKLLKSQPRPLSHVSKIPFKNTDRYFRGRIVDALRESPLHMQKLRDHIEHNHGLTDKKRFGVIIEQLMIDKLITIRGSLVSLD